MVMRAAGVQEAEEPAEGLDLIDVEQLARWVGEMDDDDGAMMELAASLGAGTTERRRSRGRSRSRSRSRSP